MNPEQKWMFLRLNDLKAFTIKLYIRDDRNDCGTLKREVIKSVLNLYKEMKVVFHYIQCTITT